MYVLNVKSNGKACTFIFRAVYDGDECEKFQQRLAARIKSHDKEIERMCNYHYQGFIDSIRELQQVSGDAAALKVSLGLILKDIHFSQFSDI